jgi:hypothetical protein
MYFVPAVMKKCSELLSISESILRWHPRTVKAKTKGLWRCE